MSKSEQLEEINIRKKTEIHPEFIGIASINSFIPNISSPRAVMLNSHFSQHLPLIKPDSKLIKSGTEYELGKYINDNKIDHDCIVKAVIPRYGNYGLQNIPSYLVIIEYEKDGGLFLDYVEVNTFKSTHNFFGYKLTPTDDFNNIIVNQKLDAGTILSKSNSYMNDTSYGYGVNANVAMMTHPSVSEDGYVVSKSFLDKIQSHSVIKRIININKNTFPVNLYGDETKFKFIPDIGENVRPDGLLCALRERNDWFNVADLSNTSLKEVDSIFDNLNYVNPNSVVVDIKVVRGNYNKNEFNSKITEQLDMYADMLTNYYKNIVSQVNFILNEKKTMHGHLDFIRLSPKLHRLLTDSQIKVDSVTNNKIKLTYRKLPIDQYRIEITTMSVIKPSLGFKLTDIHAKKI